jgi:hypothetical protein
VRITALSAWGAEARTFQDWRRVVIMPDVEWEKLSERQQRVAAKYLVNELTRLGFTGARHGDRLVYLPPPVAAS